MFLVSGLWNLATFVLTSIGRVTALILGLALVLVGIVLTITVVGAVVGVPLIIIGLLLTARGLF
jgi:hypothetical protein